jgi:hypothetical protein
MPILIQCSNCHRKLRVQDQLVGKAVKCPNCHTKFLAKAIEDGPAPAAPTAELTPTPVVPIVAEVAAPTVKTLELSQPTPKTAPPTPTPRTAERIVTTAPVEKPAAAPAPPPTPPPPPPFPTPPWRVFVVLGVLLLLTATVSLGLSWLVTSAINRASETRQKQE